MIRKLTLETINEFATEVHRNAVDHGWWKEEIKLPEIISLIHSEISEVLEEYRKGRQATEVYPGNNGKPEGIPIELADAIIRILDYCGYPKEETTETYHSASVLYPGDQIYFKSKFRPTYQVNIYEKFQHTWEFENTGTQVWRGRRLYFLNHDAVRPRADANYIDIPDTPPHKGVKITVSMDARGFEGKSECKWIMVDNDDNDCFPNSNTFTFFVSAKFEYQK